MNKKGITFDVIRVLIVLALSLVLMLGIYNILFVKIQEDTEKKICSSSVYANHLMHMKGLNIGSDDINCPTEYYTEKSKKPVDIKRTIGEKMVDCWDIYGQGKYKLFSENQVYCSVCTVIDFKQDDINVGNLEEFLSYNKLEDKNISYMDYLLNYESPRARKYIDDETIFDKSDSKLSEQIYTGSDYSVIYVHAKGKTAISNVKEKLGRGGSSVVLGLGSGAIGGIAGGLAAAKFLPVLLLGASPPGWLIGGVGATVALTVGVPVAFETYFTGEEDYHLSFVLLKEHSLSEFDDLGCDYYPAIQKEYSIRE